MHGAGSDPTSSRSVGECPVRSAIEAFHIKNAKIKVFKDQNDEKEKVGPTFWSHFLVPRFGPTFCGDLVKIGRESKREKTHQESIRRPLDPEGSTYTLGHGDSMLIEGKITLFKHQNDDWSHFSVPLFGPTFLFQATFSKKADICLNFGGALV